jgi:hypothetical protein
MRLKKAIAAAIALLNQANKAKTDAIAKKDVAKAIAALEKGLKFASGDGGDDKNP